jgi:hypothetical protein
VDDRVEDTSVGFAMARSGPSLRACLTMMSTLKEVCAKKGFVKSYAFTAFRSLREFEGCSCLEIMRCASLGSLPRP